VASVQRDVRTTAARKRVKLSIQREAASADPIGEAAGDRVEADQFLPGLEAPHAKHDIAEMALAVGHHDLGDRAAPRGNLHDHAVVVAKRDQLHFAAVLGDAEARHFGSWTGADGLRQDREREREKKRRNRVHWGLLKGSWRHVIGSSRTTAPGAGSDRSRPVPGPVGSWMRT